ncbi:MAG: Spy/CpxP family protein refolding chaperone [Ignavibacteriae bacterium]|nr:Spy/CpxP family protein refolding chaperone [Ignavibacteriota bacterium]
MKKLFMFVVLSAFVLIQSQNLFAQKQKNIKDNFLGIKKLNLTEEQKKKFDQIQFNQEEKIIDLQAKLKMNRLEIKKLFNSENFSENEFVSLTQNAGKLRNDLSDLRTKMWLDVYKILDKAQKEDWKKHFAEMPDDFREKARDFKRMHNFDGERGKRNLMPPPPPMEENEDEPEQEN